MIYDLDGLTEMNKARLKLDLTHAIDLLDDESFVNIYNNLWADNKTDPYIHVMYEESVNEVLKGKSPWEVAAILCGKKNTHFNIHDLWFIEKDDALESCNDPRSIITYLRYTEEGMADLLIQDCSDFNIAEFADVMGQYAPVVQES